LAQPQMDLLHQSITSGRTLSRPTAQREKEILGVCVIYLLNQTIGQSSTFLLSASVVPRLPLSWRLLDILVVEGESYEALFLLTEKCHRPNVQLQKPE
jgi:hypothetical protein